MLLANIWDTCTIFIDFFSFLLANVFCLYFFFHMYRYRYRYRIVSFWKSRCDATFLHSLSETPKFVEWMAFPFYHHLCVSIAASSFPKNGHQKLNPTHEQINGKKTIALISLEFLKLLETTQIAWCWDYGTFREKKKLTHTCTHAPSEITRHETVCAVIHCLAIFNRIQNTSTNACVVRIFGWL